MKKLPHLLLCGLLTLTTLFFLTACNNGSETSEALSHISRSETYAEQGQYRAAMLEVKNAIQREPDNASYRVSLAELYFDIGAYKQAEGLLQPWLESHPELVALPLARTYLARGKHLSAGETIANFEPKTSSEQLQAALIKAHSLRLSGKPAAALESFTALQIANPGSLEAVKGQIETQLYLGKTTAANETAKQWLSTNGANSDVLLLRGMVYYQVNDLDNAVATLTDAIAMVPSADVFLPVRRDILKLLSLALTEQGKVTEAQVYNRVLANNTNPEAQDQTKSALKAIRENRLDEAEKLLSNIIKLAPENAQVALLMGAVAIRQGKLDEGLALLTENLDPETSATPFIQTATLAQIDRGERREAYRIISRAVAARPNDSTLLTLHGLLAITLSSHEVEGEASLKKVLTANPENTRIRLALTQHYITADRPEDALTQMRAAFANNPEQWTVTGLYLSLLLQSDLVDEVKDVRESLINGYPTEPLAILLVGIADAGLGNTDDAIARLEALLREKPDLPQTAGILARLYIGKGQEQKAIETLINAAKIAPDDIAALQQASQVFARGQTLESVVDWLDDIGKAHPELAPNATALAAMAEIRQNKLEAARVRLANTGSRDTYPNLQHADTQLLIAEAELAIQGRNWKLARAKTAEAVALQPTNQTLALAQVRIPMLEGKPEGALPVLDELEKTFGATPPIIAARADALLASGDTAEAIGQYELILKRQPNHISALNNLAWLLKKSNKNRALELARKASDLAPENAAVLDTYGWILHLQGQHAQALKISEKAYALAPDNAEIKGHRDAIEQAL